MATRTTNLNSPTTTTTTTTTEVTVIRYNGLYVRTVPGMLKIACLILDLIGFICIQVSAFSYYSKGSFFCSVAMTGFWFTGIMLLLYLFQIVYKFPRIPWLRIEMYFCAVWTLAFMLASSLAATLGWEAYTAAAFFGFCAMIAYGYDAFLKFKDLRTIPTNVQQTTITVA